MVDTEKYAMTFSLLDTDKDGLVSAHELKQIIEALGDAVTDAQAEEAVRLIDSDGDGLVSLDELASYLDSRAAS